MMSNTAAGSPHSLCVRISHLRRIAFLSVLSTVVVMLLLNRTLAIEVVLDFQNVPAGEFSEQVLVPDGLGGYFALIPAFNPGSTYSIVDESGDRELRLADLGRESGSAALDIYHTGAFFTVVSGGEYEALPTASRGFFFYEGFSDGEDVSTVEDTPMVFDNRHVSKADLNVNGFAVPFPGTNLTVDVDDLHFDVSPPPPGVVIPTVTSARFVEEPNYADPATKGYTTFAMRVTATFDWTLGQLEIDLDSGHMRHLNQFGPIGVVLGLGDTGVFGPTDVIGDLSTTSFANVLQLTETDTFFSVEWSDLAGIDLGEFDVAAVTLSDDANGTLTFTSTHRNGQEIQDVLQIVNGRIIPEPAGLVLGLAFLFFTIQCRLVSVNSEREP